VTRVKWVSAPTCAEDDRHTKCRIERAERFLGTLQEDTSPESRKYYAEMQALPDSTFV
jgi:hypothetical protein